MQGHIQLINNPHITLPCYQPEQKSHLYSSLSYFRLNYGPPLNNFIFISFTFQLQQGHAIIIAVRFPSADISYDSYMTICSTEYLLFQLLKRLLFPASPNCDLGDTILYLQEFQDTSQFIASQSLSTLLRSYSFIYLFYYMQQKSKKKQEQVQEEHPKVKEELPISDKQSIKFDAKQQIQAEHRFSLGTPDTKVYCCKFDQDDKYIACSCENGQIRVFNVKSGKLSYVIYSQKPNTPFSYVKWRPQLPQFKTRNIFVTCNTEGEVQHYHLTSGKCLGTIKEESMDPQLFCLDYNREATKLAVCGSDPIIKIYDEEKRVCETSLGVEATQPPGHSSRVYTVKFDKENPNLLLTGGWDYRVILWDIRERKPSQGIYGPLICGDGIDIYEDNILTSSWTQSNQLQIWDLKTCKLITTVDWDSTLKTSSEPVFLYSGQFSKIDGTLILAGGSNSNEAKLFDRTDIEKAVVSIYDIAREITTVDFANKGNQFAISGGDGYVRVFTMNISA